MHDTHSGRSAAERHNVSEQNHVLRGGLKQKQGKELMRNFHGGRLPANVEAGNYGYAAKKIIFVYGHAVTVFEHFKSNLLRRLPISDATLVLWRKSRNPRATLKQLTGGLCNVEVNLEKRVGEAD